MRDSGRDSANDASPRVRGRDEPRFPTSAPARWMFRIAAGFAAGFVVIVLLLSAAAFSEVESTGIAFVERHAGVLIALGVAGTLLSGIAAMAVDRFTMPRSSPPAGSHADGARTATDRENSNATDGPGDAPAT